MYKKHDFWDNLRGKIRIILSVNSILFKPETQNLNVRSTNKTVWKKTILKPGAFSDKQF